MEQEEEKRSQRIAPVVPKFLGCSGTTLSTLQTLAIGLPAFILFGYNQTGISNAISLEAFQRHFPAIATIGKDDAAAHTAKTLQGVVVSTFSLGALVGALFCNFMGDKLGRKRMILLGALAVFIGQALECSAFQIAQLVVGRTILGMGIGVLNVTVPTWQGECSAPKSRGKHVALDGAFISLGYLMISWISFGFYMTQQTHDVVWRVPIALGTIFTIPLASILFLPESPRWLITKDRDEEAKRVIACMKETSVDSETVAQEVASIRAAYMKSIEERGTYKEMFHSGKERILQRFLTSLYLQMIQQMSGGNLISVYSTTLYQVNLGMSPTLARILSCCTLTFKFLCGFIAFFTVDKFGRRPLIMISGTGMALCMLFLAITTSQPKSHSANIASVFFVFLFNFFIPIGFLGLNWLYVVEVSPLRFRNQIASLSSGNNWIWNFVVTMITPVAISSIGYKYYLIYFALGITIPFSVFFFFPETKGLTLEAIDEIFITASSPFTVVSTSKRIRQQLLSNNPAESIAGDDEKLIVESIENA